MSQRQTLLLLFWERLLTMENLTGSVTFQKLTQPPSFGPAVHIPVPSSTLGMRNEWQRLSLLTR